MNLNKLANEMCNQDNECTANPYCYILVHDDINIDNVMKTNVFFTKKAGEQWLSEYGLGTVPKDTRLQMIHLQWNTEMDNLQKHIKYYRTNPPVEGLSIEEMQEEVRANRDILHSNLDELQRDADMIKAREKKLLAMINKRITEQIINEPI